MTSYYAGYVFCMWPTNLRIKMQGVTQTSDIMPPLFGAQKVLLCSTTVLSVCMCVYVCVRMGFSLQDTEAVHPLLSWIKEAARLRSAAAAALLEGNKCQSAPCGSLREQQAVPLLGQLLVKQGAEQHWTDGVHHI